MKEKILKLRKEGRSINEISSLLGCPISTISYNINKIEGINYGGFENTLVEKIIELFNDGKVVNEISELLLLKKDDVKKIRRLNQTKITFSISDEEIIKKYHEIKTLKGTAKHFNISYEVVKKILFNHKIVLYSSTIKKKTTSEIVIDWRKRTKEKLLEYKGGKCQCCGYKESISALHFHHINSNEKDFTIGGKSYSFERLKNEVDKCLLVCSNCHCEIHDEINEKGYSDKVNKIIN